MRLPSNGIFDMSIFMCRDQPSLDRSYPHPHALPVACALGFILISARRGFDIGGVAIVPDHDGGAAPDVDVGDQSWIESDPGEFMRKRATPLNAK
jgi:hypothetical protein